MNLLSAFDPEMDNLIKCEEKRQKETLMLIPSENYTSEAVKQALSSFLSHKYAEGYPGKRYYQGQEYIDKIESLVINRAKKLFGVPYINCQPHSGSPANLAVYLALVKPGDILLGLDLSHGGHLTHGAKVSITGQYFKSVAYGVEKDGLLDYTKLAKIAKRIKPKLIISGATAYPRKLDWEQFSFIAKSNNSYLLADISHLGGLVAAKAYPSPVPFVDIITTTTHKTLRGPRGALIMVTKNGLKKDPDLPLKIDRMVFPGLQGGPHMHTIAAIGVALKEANTSKFKQYGKKVVSNCKVLADEMMREGIKLIANGTDSHLVLVDLGNFDITGNLAAEALEAGGIVVNKNSIPYDPNPPFYPTGIRLGTPAVTTRGMGEKEMQMIAKWIGDVLREMKGIKKESRVKLSGERKKQTREKLISKSRKIPKIKMAVKQLCFEFPVESSN